MKNIFIKTTGAVVLALLLVVGATQNLVSGQEKESGRTMRSLEGVWQTTVTQRNCQTGDVIRTFQGLSTYHEGGTVSETSAALGPALRSPGYGVWDKNGHSTYSASFVFLRFNPDGTFAGTQKTTSSIVLGSEGSTYDTTSSIQVYDVNGNLLGNGCATATATRFEQ